MKLLATVLLVLACGGFCAAQEAPPQDDSPPGLVILKMKRERRREQPSDVKHTASDPDALNNGGLMPSGRDSQFPTFVYEYSIEIRNDLPKGIKWLSWIYILSDPDNRQELDRREVVSFEKISPGKKKTVYDRKRLSPSFTGSEDRKRKNGPSLEERVDFLCVSYDDGTLWHPRFIPESRCREAGKSGKSR
jgi:hypothetical protein